MPNAFLHDHPDVRRSLRVLVGLLFVCIVGVALVVGYFVCREAWPVQRWWGWVLALVPAVLILQQMIYLLFVKRPATYQGDGQRYGEEACPVTKRSKSLRAAKKHVSEQGQLYFNPRTIGSQYGLLIVLHIVVGLTVFTVCMSPPFQKNIARGGARVAATPGATQSEVGAAADSAAAEAKAQEADAAKDEFAVALRLGALGAYVYVLTYLGRRSFQRDITSGAAVWSAVQLVLGPTLAVTLAYFFRPDAEANGSITYQAVYFLAGLSPRLVTDWVSTAAQRLWTSTAAGAAVTRNVPLRTLRGITEVVETRLGEEGIDDAGALAMANPVRLLRATPYDPRQILGWIDEAILIAALPQHWQALENEGITGAIDLAWYALDDDEEEDSDDGEPVEPNVPPAAPAPPVPAPPAQVGQGGAGGHQPAGGVDPQNVRTQADAEEDQIAKLADRVHIDPDSLRAVAERLVCDDQVEMVWAMYESNGV